MPKLIRHLAFLNLLAGSLLAQLVITNKPASVRAMTFYQFTVTVNGSNPGNAVTWYVDDVTNGNATLGVFGGSRYNAPAFPPAGNVVTIKAVSTVDPTLSDSATVTILNPEPSVASVSPWPLPAGSANIIINGWGFVNGATVLMNGVALFTTYVSPIRMVAATNLKKTPSNDTAIAVVNPDPGSLTSTAYLVPPATKSRAVKVSGSAARRFLEQAAFGADPYSLSRVQALGFNAWIDEQMSEPISTYQDPTTIGYGIAPVQARFFTNAVHGRDQLRQRIAWALHKIWVVSGTEINNPWKLIPYLRILSDLAFDNYRTIMYKITLNPAMGDYLDTRNNSKADPVRNTLANENYAREIMQLFSIGLYQLHPDGTRQLDANGNPIPTYTQSTIAQFARVYTGWTYPTMPGATAKKFNPPYYEGDMVAWQDNHDTGAKTLLNGVTLPAGQLADTDLNEALDNIFNHPNVGPFIGKDLIQQLVTSNPSPEYVARVAAAFNDNGSGVRGDMKAVIKAILLDPEAREGDDNPTPDASAGHLKEPALFLAETLRGLGAQVNDANNLNTRSNALGQNIFTPSSVFSYFSPFHLIEDSGGLLGPEFQIDTRSTAIERANQINTLLYGSTGWGAGAVVDLTPWANLAATPSALADALGGAFLLGQMPAPYRNELLGAITGTAGSDLNKAKAALYVTLTSGYYSVKK